MNTVLTERFVDVVFQQIKAKHVSLPSGPTMSRARFRLELLHFLWRRKTWSTEGLLPHAM